MIIFQKKLYNKELHVEEIYKNMVKLTVLLVAISFCFYSCNISITNVSMSDNPSSWKKVDVYQRATNEIGLPYNIQQFYIQDSLHGYIVGDYDGAERKMAKNEDRKVSKANYDAIVFRTQDGGLNFTRHNIGKGSVDEVFGAAETNSIYIRVNRFSDGLQQFLHTSDYGQTWDTIFESNTARLFKCKFWNEEHGFISLEEDGIKKILITYDRGISWEECLLGNADGLIFAEFIAKDTILSAMTGSRKLAFLNTTTKEISIETLPNTPKDIISYGNLVQDNTTKSYYVELYDKHVVEKEYPNIYPAKRLLNVTTGEIISFTFPAETGSYNLSNGYIGTFIKEDTKTYYCYSPDLGESWYKEPLPNPIVFHGRNALYKQYAWQEDGGHFILQVRVLNESHNK